MSLEHLIFEIAKLALQLAGATFIAWLTVRWALRRYKSEKMWERRLSAYTDLATSLGEMRAVVGRWFDDEIMQREPSKNHQAQELDRYQTARRRLSETSAAAQLLLPKETADILQSFETNLEKARKGQDRVTDLDDQYGVIQRALDEIVRHGRKRLEIPND